MEDETLQQLKNVELEIMDTIHRLCTEEGLTYFLVGGSALGALRHQGFIPWDDDIDIGMPRGDYERFLELCRAGKLPADYNLQHDSTDDTYTLFFAKVRKRNTRFIEPGVKESKEFQGIFVDVFPLDSCAERGGIFYHIRATIIREIRHILFLRGFNRMPQALWGKVIMLLLAPFSSRTLCRWRHRLATRQAQGDWFINYGSNYAYLKQTMPKDVYLPTATANFEGREYCVPHRCERYLELLFGDWRQLPPEDKRRNHNPVQIVLDVAAEEDRTEK